MFEVSEDVKEKISQMDKIREKKKCSKIEIIKDFSKNFEKLIKFINSQDSYVSFKHMKIDNIKSSEGIKYRKHFFKSILGGFVYIGLVLTVIVTLLTFFVRDAFCVLYPPFSLFLLLPPLSINNRFKMTVSKFYNKYGIEGLQELHKKALKEAKRLTQNIESEQDKLDMLEAEKEIFNI